MIQWKSNPSYKVDGKHSFSFMVSRKIQILTCSKCGLILLKNEATRKAQNKPCPGKEEE